MWAVDKKQEIILEWPKPTMPVSYVSLANSDYGTSKFSITAMKVLAAAFQAYMLCWYCLCIPLSNSQVLFRLYIVAASIRVDHARIEQFFKQAFWCNRQPVQYCNDLYQVSPIVCCLFYFLFPFLKNSTVLTQIY